MKIISNFILVFSICATLKFILIEQLKLNDYENIINKVLYVIILIPFIRIFLRIFKS